MPLLGSDGGAGSFEVTLWLDRLIDAAERDGMFTLLIELDAPAACAPEWAPRATDSLWFSRVPREGYEPLPPERAIADTCGLAPAIVPATAEPDALLGDISAQWAMRDLEVAPPAALVILVQHAAPEPGRRCPPMRWSTAPVGCGARACGASAFRPTGRRPARPSTAWCRTRCASNASRRATSSPPVLMRLVPNVAVARQVQSVQPDAALIEPQLDGWLKLPGQRLALDRNLPEPIEDSVQLELRELDGEWHRWRVTDDLYRHGPEDRVFVVDRPHKLLRFGNGLTGRIPVLAAPAGCRPRRDAARTAVLPGGRRRGGECGPTAVVVRPSHRSHRSTPCRRSAASPRKVSPKRTRASRAIWIASNAR